LHSTSQYSTYTAMMSHAALDDASITAGSAAGAGSGGWL
jgi:hypothetical protein